MCACDCVMCSCHCLREESRLEKPLPFFPSTPHHLFFVVVCFVFVFALFRVVFFSALERQVDKGLFLQFYHGEKATVINETEVTAKYSYLLAPAFRDIAYFHVAVGGGYCRRGVVVCTV